eukprot:2054669-Prymnesium_polylepis.1
MIIPRTARTPNARLERARRRAPHNGKGSRVHGGGARAAEGAGEVIVDSSGHRNHALFERYAGGVELRR